MGRRRRLTPPEGFAEGGGKAETLLVAGKPQRHTDPASSGNTGVQPAALTRSANTHPSKSRQNQPSKAPPERGMQGFCLAGNMRINGPAQSASPKWHNHAD